MAPVEGSTAEVQQLIDEIDGLSKQQQQALQDGDLEAFGRLQKELDQKIAALKAASEELAAS